MTAAIATPVRLSQEFLDSLLCPIHNVWVVEARRFLEPALDPSADFWTRWAATRYISDGFQQHYRRERAFVNELRDLLPPAVLQRLVREGDRLLQLRLELDRLGRRRGTAAEFATATRKLLDQLCLWCTEIEVAAHGVTRAALTPGGADLLANL